MKTFKFKTNLKCNNCVAKVKSQLDITDEIQSWSIDLKSPDRILTIKAKDEKAVASVERILAEAGYLAEVYPVESYITKNDKTMKDVKKESDKQSKPTTIKGCGCGNTEKPGKSQKMANDETTEDDIQGASNYERAESDQSKGIFAQQTKAYNKNLDIDAKVEGTLSKPVIKPDLSKAIKAVTKAAEKELKGNLLQGIQNLFKKK